ncbi:MAG TPA: hydrogenase 4 subunit B [Stellaceae bacterium]|nr:hydrogenase 4 subunit B [Stellaceae bacterium]
MLSLLALSVGIYGLACFLGALLGRRALVGVYALSALAAALSAANASAFLATGGAPEDAVLPFGLPWLGALFHADALSAFFLLVVGVAATLTSVFAIGYGRHETEPRRILPFYPLFLAGMSLVLVAADAFTFLLSWELMSVASWLLVLASHRERETSNAALLYLVMASLGAGALLLAFGLLSAGSGDYAFAAMRGTALSGWKSTLFFLLVVIGAGSKAGVVPLHAWLPPAHAAAPSHVSALMSGVMTKVALYGFVRLIFDLAGPAPWWWGALVLLLGGITALLGVLYAVMQHDLKRLLAYHTVENIGIVVIGLGLALAFRANGLGALAVLALAAALLHVFNHAMFKSLLFLGSGAILVATHERDMEHLGGLIHPMPVTAFVFLIGAVAISALPPFNGFVSEWLTFQAIVNGSLLPQWLLKFAVPVVGAMLALAAALAAVCFVKVFGVVFLGRPRRPAAAAAREVGALMLAPMAALAAICTVVGLVPQTVLGLLRPVTALLLPESPWLVLSNWLWLAPLGADHSSYSGLVILLAIAFLAALLVVVVHRLGSDRVRRSPAWDCGFPDARPETQYGASSFAQPIRRIFGTVAFAARERIDMPAPGETRAARLEVRLRDPVWDGLYAPATAAVAWLADHMNVLQFQTIRRYLTLMFAALVLLLLIVAVSQ